MKKQRSSVFVLLAAVILLSCNTWIVATSITPTLSSTMVISSLPSETPLPTTTSTPLSPTPIPTLGFWVDDYGSLLKLPCSAPCFFGITVGQTESESVMSILRQNGITNCDKKETYVVCPDLGRHTGISFDAKFVTGISFQPESVIHLGGLTNKLGSPDHVVVVDRSFVRDEPTVEVSFYYDEYLMVFSSPDHRGTNVYLDKETYIVAWSYHDPQTYQSRLSAWAVSHDPFLSHVSNWKGYGIYTFK